jgi:hypothetical protein
MSSQMEPSEPQDEDDGQTVASPSIRQVVAELRGFIAELKSRPDIAVEVARVGGPAPLDKLAFLRAQEGVPEELVDFYAEMDGVHVSWRFIEPPGGGCLEIPPISEETRFQGDDETFMNFGAGCTGLLLDVITAEGNTWLLRSGGKVRIVFASMAEGDNAFEVAGSLAEYLAAAMRHGFVPYWPCCLDGHDEPNIDYSAEQAAIRRFQDPPKVPTPRPHRHPRTVRVLR